MTFSSFAAQNLVHVAAIFTLICYLFRDQIKLRLFAALGDALLTIYYVVAFPVPLWNAMYWTILNVIINVTMILLLLRDRRMTLLSDDEMTLFRALDTLSPGQFRKLLKLADWHVAEEPAQLTAEGEKPAHLYYILSGDVTIAKQGRSFAASPRTFIGEIAFLRGTAASATVTTPPNAHYVAWPVDALQDLFKRNEDLKNAFSALLSADMADKVARA
ncbi:MAG: cyclic nucleotide-binding domain-containing protein [Hyphomicrobiales bacterium]